MALLITFVVVYAIAMLTLITLNVLDKDDKND